MRMVWVAVGIIALISAAAAGLYWYNAQLHGQLQDNLGQLEGAVQAENWAEVKEISRELGKTWNKADTAWSPVMDRRDIDRVDESLIRVAHLSTSHQKDELLLEISMSKRFVDRLLQKESISIKSVF